MNLNKIESQQDLISKLQRRTVKRTHSRRHCPREANPVSPLVHNGTFLFTRNFKHLAFHGQHRKVQTGALANDCKDCELDTNAPGQAAFPHLKAGIGITSLNSPADGIIPDIHDSIPPDEDAVKESHELKEGIKK